MDKDDAKKIRDSKEGEVPVDAAQMERLAVLVEQGKAKEAQRNLRNMDTFVRGGIPSDVVHNIRIAASGGSRVISAVVRLKGTEKVFSEELGPGVLGRVDFEFPKDMKDQELAMSLLGVVDSTVDKVIEVEFREDDKSLFTTGVSDCL